MKALVTGANKGIGFEIARNLGKRGYDILVGARDEARGPAAVEKLAAEGISAAFIKIDLNDLASLHTAAKMIDSLDILVNNAGIPDSLKPGRAALDITKHTFDYTTEDLRTTMETNFLGTHELTKNLLSRLTDTGKIVNITVPISPTEFWHPLAYITSKAALNVMTLTYAYEFEKMGSHRQIFGIMPGAVATDLNGMEAGAHSGFVKSLEAAGRMCTDIILSDKNQNGQMIQYDGKTVTDYEIQLRG
ncbi:SDR family NAD(P)-dependent oxidoreductase [Alicyclobacillus sp. SO9]|uniref:SDR family NAD(P)-dependent oxidoreductase n=1 Tax=Alicyclobacillus sp. SO9 TaxID=2665646 RepID=UPI0018E7A829|nr:SDR family NAD(P)-dependent oxidoreductase [Alicyclobacillus sp. SO9]QQE77112.1 SDR family NAD(P)-dependent oxidoreductase [Alicyclobacillus sp. SO9]